jgi:hypothetical protein
MRRRFGLCKRNGAAIRGACGFFAATLWLAALPQHAAAKEFEVFDGKVAGHFDTTISTGVIVRSQTRANDLIGKVNGGTANSDNTDDGDLNYNIGDVTSAQTRVNHELQMSYGRYSIFSRVYYFYDPVIKSTATERTPLTDIAKRRAGIRIQPLDAYGTGDFTVFDRPLTVRLGNQVVSWGESTFIQNGINVINPVDVTLLRAPGAEVRNALRPIPAIDLSTAISDRFSVEAFYQFLWDETKLEPRGTYFSTSDLVSPGSQFAMLGFGSVSDNPIPPPPPPTGNSIPRSSDHDASNNGQFGLALRYFEPSLWSTEFGAYYIRYHSRLPLISARTGTMEGVDAGNYAGSANYFLEFPENIDMVGTSFSNSIASTGIAIQGELSYKFNQPIQIDDTEILFAGFTPLPFRIGDVFAPNQIGTFGFNQYIQGYRRKGILQPQLTATKLFGPTFGADQILVLGEVGATLVMGMQNQSVLRYEGPGTYTSGNPYFTNTNRPLSNPPAKIQPATQVGGFADAQSWGYRLVARPTFNRAIGAVNLEPTVAFQHDVTGTSPSPILNFVQDRKAVSLSLRGVYLEQITGEVGYTNYFDGGSFNLLKDRDFFSVAFSYSL